MEDGTRADVRPIHEREIQMRSITIFSGIMFVTIFGLAASADQAPADRAALEKAFIDKLSGAALVGTFSVEGRAGAKPERYEIDSVKKHQGDDWIVTARIKYGEHDVKLPMVVKVFWADDTPMISLTNLTIPGLGTFTSRVMFYEDRYAGTWQHGEHGGHLWGLIEKPEPADEAKDQK